MSITTSKARSRSNRPALSNAHSSHARIERRGAAEDVGWWRPGELNVQGVPLPDSIAQSAVHYRRVMVSARRSGETLEVTLLIVTAAIPAAAAMGAEPVVGTVLGSIAAVGIGLRRLFGWQRDALVAARTSAQIDAEIAKFQAASRPYHDPTTAAARLVDRVETIVKADVEGGPPEPEPT